MKKIIHIRRTVDKCFNCGYRCSYSNPFKTVELPDGTKEKAKGLHMCYHANFLLSPKFLCFFDPGKNDGPLKSMPIPEWCPLENEEKEI